uniref:2Fe-2S ferredoxin-type domain-containing protein n=1 Tax=Glycine max TaxID=3847 RepID=A0A0R0FV95_SOYBN
MSLLQLQLSSHALRSITSSSHNFRPTYSSKRVSYVRTRIRAVGTVPEKDSDSDTTDPDEPPYVGLVFVSARPLLNCGGGGTCGTCMVEVLEGKELLNPRTDKEKEILKKKPKNWRLACQTIVGKPDSRGAVVIQQLPEWKGHEWKYAKPGESNWESD